MSLSQTISPSNLFEISAANVLAWVQGIGNELAFWDTWASTKGGQWGEDFNRRTSAQPGLEVQEALAFARESELRMLDAGSGLISSVGIAAENVRIDLHACDPLAPFYKDILSKYSIRPYITTEFAFVEDLRTRYPQDYFDVAHVRNALDHSFAPVTGIQQLLSVVRVGGGVLLHHYENEAEFEGYQGFHQWNFTERDGRFLIWNQRQTIDVAEVLGDCASVQVRRYGEASSRHSIGVSLTKRGNPTFVNSFKNIFDQELLRILVSQLRTV